MGYRDDSSDAVIKNRVGVCNYIIPLKQHFDKWGAFARPSFRTSTASGVFHFTECNSAATIFSILSMRRKKKLWSGSGVTSRTQSGSWGFKIINPRSCKLKANCACVSSLCWLQFDQCELAERGKIIEATSWQELKSEPPYRIRSVASYTPGAKCLSLSPNPYVGGI